MIYQVSCLITGVAGFIGSHLAKKLLAEGWRVIGIDNFSPYYDPQQKRVNLSALLVNPDFTFLELDVHDLTVDIQLPSVQYVFHLAGRPGVRPSFGRQFHLYLQDNVLATERLLERCLDWPLRKFIFASSSSVYGSCHRQPQKESDPPRPASPYAFTKLAAELLCAHYWRRHHLPAASARLFTVYGPGQRPDMAVHRFITAALEGRPLEVYGDGRQTRDMTFVDDAVEGLIGAARFGRQGAVYNIASGCPVSLRELVGRISRLAGLPVEIAFAKRRQGDVGHTWGDIGQAHKELGYTPSVTLNEGIAQQIEAIRTGAPFSQGTLNSKTKAGGGNM